MLYSYHTSFANCASTLRPVLNKQNTLQQRLPCNESALILRLV